MAKNGGMQVFALPPGAYAAGRELRRVLRKLDRVTLCSAAEERLPWIKHLLPEDGEIDIKTLGELVGKTALLLRIPTRRLALQSQVHGALRHVCIGLGEANQFHGSRAYPGLHESLARTHQELRHYGISPLALRRAAEAAGFHGKKLASLADVLDGLELRLAEVERTHNSSVIEQILESEPVDFRSIGHLVFFAGSERHPDAARFLHYLHAAGVPMTIFLDGWAGGDTFPESAQWAQDLGVTPQPAGATPTWLTQLFTSGHEVGGAPVVQIAGMCDRVVECEWAIREAMAAMSEGIAPPQIAIVARDLQDYLPLLSFAAQRFGVPMRANVRIPIISNSFVRLLHQLMLVVAGHDVRRLAGAVRSSYFGVSRTDHKLGLDALVTAHQHAADPWGRLGDWIPFAPESYRWLGELLAWRSSVVDEKAPLLRWVDHWRLLLEIDPLPTTVMSDANPTYERDVRAKNAAETALLGFASAFSAEDRLLSFDDFATLVEEVWSEADVSLPPTHPSGVRVVSSPHQLGECQFVIAVGMVEGALPRSRREDPILSDEEREALAEALPDATPLPTSYQKILRERDYFLSLCAAAGRRLLLTYPLVDEDDEYRPAFYLQELKRLLGAEIELPIRDRRLVVPPAELARNLPDLSLRQALDEPRFAVDPPELSQALVKNSLRPNWEEGIRFRDLAQALRCPFAAHYGRLGIRNQDRRAVWRRLPQLPLRARLAEQPTRESAQTALREERDRFVQESFPQLDAFEVPLLEATCDRLLKQWTEREFRARELWPINPGSVRLNVAMGDEGLPRMLRAGDRKIRVLDEAPVMGQLGEYRVIQFYVDRMPSLTKSDVEREDDEDPGYSEFLYGLWALSAARTSNNRSALIIDGLRDERVLYLFTDQPATRYNGDGVRFRRFMRDDPVKGWGERLMKDVERAYAILDEGAIQPRPGPHCQWCELAELCRTSSEFEQGPEPAEETA